MYQEEKKFSALAHIFALIPFWGILGNGIIWYSFKEKSKEVIFHAHQAIFFQITLLIFFGFALLVELFCRLLKVVHLDLAMLLSRFNHLIFYIGVLIYALMCLFAAWTILSGSNYEYPIIGKKLRERD